MTKSMAFWVCWDAYIDVIWQGKTVQVYSETRSRLVVANVVTTDDLRPWEYIVESFPQGTRGGYTISSPSYSERRLKFPYLKGIHGVNSDLNLFQKYEINVAAEGFDELPAGKKIMDAFRNGSVTVAFIVDNSLADKNSGGYFICQNQSVDFVQEYSNWIEIIYEQGFFTSSDIPKFRTLCQR